MVWGVGTGWCKEEFEALGGDFEGRGGVVDEQIAIFRQACTGDEISFHGKHYQVHGTKLRPRPAQQPGPPVWVGGIHKLARKRAALLGDGWYPIRMSPEEIREALAEILELRESNGLPAEGFTTTVGIPVHFGDDPLPPAFRAAIKGSPDEMAEQIAAYSDAGVDVFTIRSSRYEFERAAEDMERFAEAILTPAA